MNARNNMVRISMRIIFILKSLTLKRWNVFRMEKWENWCLLLLTKEGMPLLRYRTKDLTSLMEGECPCGRTNIRMSGIVGRSDDMLIIRGINVFPSQVESVILDMPQFEPQYMLVVDRKNNLDSLQVQVEVRKDFFSDDMGSMLAMKKALSDKLKSVLSISAEVKLMEPNSIARSEGKSKRVIDNRILK